MMLGEGVIKHGLKDYDDGRNTVKVHGLMVFILIHRKLIRFPVQITPKRAQGEGEGR